MNYQSSTRTEQSLGELFSDLSSQAGMLIRQEMQLAEAEMTLKAKRAGRNAAFIGVGAVIGQAALLAIVAAVISALAEVMDVWLAALLVGIALAIVAAVLVQYGLSKLKEIDPAPRQTIETMRENKEWLTQQI